MLKIGLIGYGTHAKWAVEPAIQETSKRCELTAICDVSEENLSGTPSPGIATFTDYREMLAKADIDAVYVCTLSDSHFEPAVAAFEAGLHVLCEKPMADRVDKCHRMIAAAEKADRTLAIVFENRYHPYNRKVREWVIGGHLGKIEAIHYQDLWDGHKSFGDLAERRGRAIERTGSLDCGIHQLDLVRYFLGGEWQEVSAAGVWFGEEFTNPPHISLMARLTPAVLVTLNSSYSYGAYIAEHKPHSSVMTIVGSTGVVNFSSDFEKSTDLRIVSEKLSETFPHESVPHSQAIGWLADDFADVVEGRIASTPELATGRDGLMAQIVVDKALKQAREGRGDSA